MLPTFQFQTSERKASKAYQAIQNFSSGIHLCIISPPAARLCSISQISAFFEKSSDNNVLMGIIL